MPINENELHLMDEFLRVDKISDDVYSLGPNTVLKFNVALSKISGAKRYHYLNEYQYNSQATGQPLVTIKRTFDYYLSFEMHKKDSDGNKLFIRIGPKDYYLLMDGIDTVLEWFTNTKKYKGLFATTPNGTKILTSPIPSKKIGPMPMNKYIEFRPTIIEFGVSNDDKVFGIEIDFNGEHQTSITLDKFYGLKYLLSSLNMYQAAITLINYNARPYCGANRTVMEMERTLPPEPVQPKATGIIGRFVTPKGTTNNISSLEG